jgi:glycosyltransferase involved in cell wall biosynthesis
MKVLYLIHGHRNFSVGGAENAAFSLFEQCNRTPGVEAWILAAAHTSLGIVGHGELRSIDEEGREYLIGSDCDWYRFTNTNIVAMADGLRRLLDHIRPDVIHLQHYSNFGVDIIPLLQRLSPASRIVVTLHEYLGLCMHNGQMVTTGAFSLCARSTPLACSRCFPERSPQDMFLRSHYIHTILESCDALISPSEFLIQRYRDCGVSHANFHMIENGLPGHFEAIDRSPFLSDHSAPLNRFAFFGQLNLYKGVLVLLEAVEQLIDRGEEPFSVEIHGANLDFQPESFQRDVRRCLERVSSHVQLCGSYRQSEMAALMRRTDWVIVPSIWWENSPVVIQESFFFSRPVIGSNIGGTAEKTSGHGGFTFQNQSAAALADAISLARGNHALHKRMLSEMGPPFRAEDCLAAHLALYSQLQATAKGSGVLLTAAD